MKKIIILSIFTFFFCSCASRLKVRVETANREEVIKEFQKTETLPTLLALENFTATWDKQIVLDAIYDYLEKPDKNNDKWTLTNPAKTILEDEFDKKITPLVEKTKGFVGQARKSFDSKKIVDASEWNNEASYQIQKIYDILKNYSLTNPITNKTHVISLLEGDEDLKEVSKTIINGKPRTKYTIIGDPMASFITKKENKRIWKSTFNRTVAWNFFGNSDIAVVLNSSPPEREEKSGDYNNNFSIKGVRLDAADATNAIMTSLTQTINFIASTSGVPIKNAVADQENPIPQSNSAIDEFDNNIIKLESKKRKLIAYRRALIDKIKLEAIDNPDIDSTELTTAIKRIEDYWKKIKPELTK